MRGWIAGRLKLLVMLELIMIGFQLVNAGDKQSTRLIDENASFLVWPLECGRMRAVTHVNEERKSKSGIQLYVKHKIVHKIRQKKKRGCIKYGHFETT